MENWKDYNWSCFVPQSSVWAQAKPSLNLWWILIESCWGVYNRGTHNRLSVQNSKLQSVAFGKLQSVAFGIHIQVPASWNVSMHSHCLSLCTRTSQNKRGSIRQCQRVRRVRSPSLLIPQTRRVKTPHNLGCATPQQVLRRPPSIFPTNILFMWDDVGGDVFKSWHQHESKRKRRGRTKTRKETITCHYLSRKVFHANINQSQSLFFWDFWQRRNNASRQSGRNLVNRLPAFRLPHWRELSPSFSLHRVEGKIPHCQFWTQLTFIKLSRITRSARIGEKLNQIHDHLSQKNKSQRPNSRERVEAVTPWGPALLTPKIHNSQNVKKQISVYLNIIWTWGNHYGPKSWIRTTALFKMSSISHFRILRSRIEWQEATIASLRNPDLRALLNHWHHNWSCFVQHVFCSCGVQQLVFVQQDLQLVYFPLFLSLQAKHKTSRRQGHTKISSNTLLTSGTFK